MTLCGPPRCGCSIQSAAPTISVSGSGQGGDPWLLETFDAVATEIPDTRPSAPVRFEGMRVYTTDTKCTFLWNGTVWRCISQPLTPTALTRTSWAVGTGGSEAAAYSRFGHQVMLQYESSFGATGFTVGAAFFTPPVPAKWTAARQMGDAWFYDTSTSLIYHGSCDLYVADGLIRLYAPSPGVFTPSNINPFVWAVNDQMWFKLVYDVADTE